MKRCLGFLMMFFMATAAQAQNKNCADCGAKPADDGAPTEWWAASNAQILNAPCMRKTPFTEDEMTSWLNDHRKVTISASAEVKGFTLQNENPKLITAFKELVDSSSFAGVKSSSCHRVLCAVQEVFGKKLGTQLLFMHERFGMNGSQYTNAGADEWKTDELDQVLIGLSAFPENLLPQDRNKQLIHFSRGYSLIIYGENGAYVDANSMIEIFDPWNDLETGRQRMTIVHEVGHNLARWNHSDDSTSEWLKISGDWTKKTTIDKDGTSKDEWTSHTPSRVMSKYGLTNPSEDFAEMTVAYRFNSKELKKKNPEVYRLMKNVYFDGLEYTDEASCQESNSNIAKVKKALPEFQLKTVNIGMHSWSVGLDDESIAKAEAPCGGFPLSQIGKARPYHLVQDPAFLQCVQDQAKVAMLTRTAQKIMGDQKSLFSPQMADQIPDSAVPSIVSRQILSKIQSDLRTVLQASLKEYMKGVYFNDGDCDREKYPYMSVSMAVPGFNKSFSTEVLGADYLYRDSFNSFLTQACHEIEDHNHSSASKKKQVSDEEVAKTVESFFQ